MKAAGTIFYRSGPVVRLATSAPYDRSGMPPFARILQTSGLIAVIAFLSIASFRAHGQEGTARPSLTYLVIDKSGSIQTGGLVDPILGAVTEFVGALSTNTELRVVFFNDRATKEQSWRPPLDTRAKGEFIRRLQTEFRPAGQTLLFDTLGEVLQTVIAERGKYRKVEIKILSDGDDTRSSKFTSWDALKPLTKQFVTGRDNFITWITLGFDPGNRKPSADSGVATTPFLDASKGFSIVVGPVEAKPVAAFDAAPRTVKTRDRVVFRLLYPKGVTTVTWSFGDGTSGAGPEIQHNYQSSGSYAIRVEVAGPGGKDVLEMADFVQVLEKVPVRASFSASPRKAKIGEEVLFALDSAAGVTSVRWDFADGASATNSVARHAYSGAGTYIVKVAAEGPDGTDAAQLADGVEVFSELPVSASFAVSPRRAMVNEAVLFTLDSAAGVTATRWDFGDGSTASNSLARHSYAKVGDYDIAVEASGPGGKDVAMRKGFVQIRAEVPLEPIFSWAPKTVIAGQEVQLIDESVGGPTKWVWDIPGIGIRSERSPVIVFANPETVLVRLTVEKEGQRRSMAREIPVTNPPPPLLQARFEAAPVNGRSPLKVQFTDKSGGVVAKYSWDFGDDQTSDLRSPSHEYQAQGAQQSFRPRLVIRDSAGREAQDSGILTILVTPPIPAWQKFLALVVVCFLAWILLLVPLILKPLLLPHRDAAFKAATTYDLRRLALKAKWNWLWPRNFVTVGTRLADGIKLSATGSLPAAKMLGVVRRALATRSYQLIPLQRDVIAQASSRMSLQGKQERVLTPLSANRPVNLRDGDEFEIAGQRMVWKQPKN